MNKPQYRVDIDLEEMLVEDLELLSEAQQSGTASFTKPMIDMIERVATVTKVEDGKRPARIPVRKAPVRVLRQIMELVSKETEDQSNPT